MEKDKVIILDGAMGTMLQKNGMKVGQIPELLNLEDPEKIIGIHKKYIESGAEIIYTCTFGANRIKLAGYDLDKVIKKAIENAKIARGGRKDVKIALDIGPIGKMMEPMGDLKFDEAYDIFKEIILAGKEADLVVIETMTDLYELKAAILAARENSDLPILATMSFEEDERTFVGVSLESFVNSVEGLGVEALGLNCSVGPVQMYEMAKKLVKMTDKDIIIKPNAGMPNMDGSYDLTNEEFAENMTAIAELGVKYLGGCCGTDDSYIKLLADSVKGNEVNEREVEKIYGPSSASKFISNENFLMAGERLNPTGKKKYQEALEKEDIAYFVSKAIEQVDAGADILDLNVGHPGIDEARMQEKIIKGIQAVIDTPLIIDSSKGEAIEAALRAYNGKAIVNSVNGEDEKLEEILPLVKKYNAQVIGLALDENGIPDSIEDRVKIARKIVKRAGDYGIEPRDIYIDCLTLTVSSNPEGAMDTLKAIEIVKEELGVRTALGVSNISFGLPNRELINQSFLIMAMYAGLDLAIINPNSKTMVDSIKAAKLLKNVDGATDEFIGAFSDKKVSVSEPKSDKKEDYDINTAVFKGLDSVVRDKVTEMLKEKNELDIINEDLIPALDIVGDNYERGDIFLPQLIKASNAAQAGFSVIQNFIKQGGGDPVSKGDIVMATVKGDVHDIGKNIVSVILENYGYNVIDLGKDVPIETVVATAKERNVKLVGLSALMTTTLENMKLTIEALREEMPDVKIMVGGAVLTEEYSKKIGADFYGKDAKASVDYANELFGVNN
ncbi:MAG: homocysteine S-methyltransferase family protein [Finegoldia sp.]|nr:homocysteine S-methyltransferase family protein [Finegoldia sp.]